MTARKTILFARSGAGLIAAALATVAVLVDPTKANETRVTPQQLAAYEQVFMDQVKKGDLLFHGEPDWTRREQTVSPLTKTCHESSGPVAWMNG